MFDISAQQRQASDPKANVYVSASAGTGKTKVLCDRVIRLMLEGSKVGNVLCLTFTNAAAWEMKERIASRLKNWLMISDEDLQSQLKMLEGIEVSNNVLDKARTLYGAFLDDYDSLKIQTIHSLCSQIINNTPSVFSSAQIIDSVKKEKLIKLAVNSALESTEDSVINARGKLQEFYDYNQIINLFEGVLSKKIKFSKCIENPINVFELFGVERGGQIEDMEAKFFASLSKDFINSVKALANSKIKLGIEVLNALNPVDFKKYKNCFYTKEGSPRKTLLNIKQEQQFPHLRKLIVEETERIANFEEAKNALISAEMHEAFFVFMKFAFEHYENLKSRAAFLEYDDLLLGTIELLRGEQSNNVLLKLDYVIDHILVDEAQDLSELQWEIVKVLSEEFFSGESLRNENRTIFIVGDYKQSIYSFQGANPDLFLSIKEYFSDKVKQAQKIWREIEISTSFRTTAPVLNLVDKIFNNPEYKSALGADADISHTPFRKGDGFTAAIPLALKQLKTKQQGWKIPSLDEEINDPKQVIANSIANEIHSWLSKGRRLLGHNRVIQPKDILILVRKRGAIVGYIINSLKKLGIPVSDPDTMSLLDSIVIRDLLSALKFILLPQDDLNLACLLKSPFFNITEDELYELCSLREEKTLWDEIIHKKQDLRESLQHIISLYHNNNFQDMCIELVELARVKFRTRFGYKATNMLNKFLNVVEDFCNIEIPALQNFVERFEKSEIYVKTSPMHSDDRVRIMTAHASKGLQAPIVILADAASTENSPHENIFWHGDQIYFSSYAEYDTRFLKTLKELRKQEDREESLRLLYVAMTRAEDEIYVAGWESRNQDSSWFSILEKNMEMMDANSAYTYCEKLPSNRLVEEPPTFLFSEVKLPSKLQKTISATRKVSAESDALMRGKKIHELLMMVSKLNRDQRIKFLNNYENMEYAKVVADVMQKFPHLFEDGVLTEFPIMGVLDGHKISVRIDKLAISELKIQVVDFKTSKLEGKLSEAYQNQLTFYKKILGEKWKNKEVSTYIVWVDDLSLQEVM